MFGSREEDLEILAGDGFPLVGTAFGSSGALPRPAAVVLAPATGVQRRYYAPFARFLASRGFDALTFDYRGMGDSQALGGAGSLSVGMTDWGALDLGAALEWAAETHPGAAPLVVGHSAGGQLVGLGRGERPLGGVLAIAAQSGAHRHWPLPWRLGLSAYWRVVVPALVAFAGRLPGWAGVGADLPGGMAREWARWCLSPRYLLDHLNEAQRRGYAELAAPILALSFEGDFYAPLPAVEAWLGFFPKARRIHRRVHRSECGDVGHFGFFRERYRETLWQEAAAWLESRVGS